MLNPEKQIWFLISQLVPIRSMGNTDGPALQGILFSGGHSKWLIGDPGLTFTVIMASLPLLVEETSVPPSPDVFEELVEKNGFYLATAQMFLKHFLCDCMEVPLQ